MRKTMKSLVGGFLLLVSLGVATARVEAQQRPQEAESIAPGEQLNITEAPATEEPGYNTATASTTGIRPAHLPPLTYVSRDGSNRLATFIFGTNTANALCIDVKDASDLVAESRTGHGRRSQPSYVAQNMKLRFLGIHTGKHASKWYVFQEQETGDGPARGRRWYLPLDPAHLTFYQIPYSGAPKPFGNSACYPTVFLTTHAASGDASGSEATED
jgi:hypothetical protein